MKTQLKKLFLVPALLALLTTINSQLSTCSAQGTAFTYQGQLQDDGAPANGVYDLKFILTSEGQFPAPIISVVTNSAVGVTNGLFTVTLDFGANFPGGNRWLIIYARTNGAAAFTGLSPFQPVTPTPYAIFANSASNLLGSFQVGTMGSFIGGGGSGNTASGVNNAIGGGSVNVTSGNQSTIAGGSHNIAIGNQAVVGGGYGNSATNDYTTISGGHDNNVNAYGGTVSGGVNNTAGAYATVAGGAQNYSSALISNIGGGQNNTNTGYIATIGGGDHNYNSANEGTIAGGQNNIVSIGYQPTVGGGYSNQATNSYATVPGGYGNVAGGQYSFAAGHNAQAINNDSYVWSDGSAATTSTVNNQYMVRASGGTVIYSSSGNTAGVSLAAGSGTWSSLSDRNSKNDFAPVTAGQVLAKVASLPITKWSYKTEQGVQHIGPMAQDFYAVFGVGEDNRHITTLDEDGVALAAIQGLNQKLQGEMKEKDTEIQSLKAQMNELQQAVKSLAGKE